MYGVDVAGLAGIESHGAHTFAITDQFWAPASEDVTAADNRIAGQILSVGTRPVRGAIPGIAFTGVVPKTWAAQRSIFT